MKLFLAFLLISFVCADALQAATTAKVNASGLYLRTGPGTNHRPVASLPLLPRNTIVTINGYDSANPTWARISASVNGVSAEGFSCATYLKPFNASNPDLPVNQNLNSAFDLPDMPNIIETPPPSNLKLPSDGLIAMKVNDEKYNMPVGIYPARSGEVMNMEFKFASSVTSVEFTAASLTLGEGTELSKLKKEGTKYVADGSGERSMKLTVTNNQQPGFYKIRIRLNDSDEAIMTVASLVPFTRDAYIGNYRIGRYPSSITLKGFAKINSAAELSTPVSRNFTIGEFVCKQQPSVYPKYIAIQPKIYRKLELIRKNAGGGSLHVNSGFRTPWYNSTLDGAASLSRHMHGDATDIHASRPSSFAAHVRSAQTGDNNDLLGGVGVYRTFVHTDTRGYNATW